MDLAEKVKELVNRHLLTTTLSTVDKNGNIDVAFVNVLMMTDPETIKAAYLGKTKTYENLKTTRKGILTIIVPTVEFMKNESVCISLELMKDETEGEDFEVMQQFVNDAYGGFRVRNLLTFKINEIKQAAVI